jgi:hypothetical protein
MVHPSKEPRHLLSRAPMTGLYARYRQSQSLSDFRDAEVFEIPEEDDDSIFFRQPGECSAQANTGLAPLTFGQRRVALIGDWELSQRGRVQRHEPRGGAISPPLPDLVETNANKPSTETGFKPKLLEMGERFKCSLLDNILDFRVTADGCPDHTQQRREMRRDQVLEEIWPSSKDLANQFGFLRRRRWDRFAIHLRFSLHLSPEIKAVGDPKRGLDFKGVGFIASRSRVDSATAFDTWPTVALGAILYMWQVDADHA